MSFFGGLAEGMESGQGVAQRSRALGLQEQQLAQQAEAQRQQMALTMKKYLGESADKIIDKNVIEIDNLIKIAEEGVKNGKFAEAAKLAEPIKLAISKVQRVAAPLGLGDRIPDFMPRFEAILATTANPMERGGVAGQEAIGRTQAEIAGGLPGLQGQAEGAKSLAAAQGGGTQAAGMVAGAQEVARNVAQANAPGTLTPQQKAIQQNLLARGLNPQEAFDVATGLATVQFDPAGGQAYQLNRATGTATPTTQVAGKPSKEQNDAAGFADRMFASGDIINKVENQGLDLIAQGASTIPVLGNFLVGDKFQQYDQAQRDWVNANLRRESMALISEEEFANARRQYFPQPGDSQKVVEQKRENRRLTEANMLRNAGPAGKRASSPEVKAPRVLKFNAQTGLLE
jgi:hypothetical protein